MFIGRTFLCRFILGSAVMLPAVLSAQTDADFTIPESGAPAEVNQALRERVGLFLQYHVGPTNFKAMDLVADDTKEEYFSSGKMRLLKYAITDVRYLEGFSKARVVADATREMSVQTDVMVVTVPMVMTWKVENGKWAWYHDPTLVWTTPMGPSAAAAKPLQLLNADGTPNLPKNFDSPSVLLAQAQAIMQQSKVDKSTVTLVQGKASQEQVAFQNGYGEVNLELAGVPTIPGLRVSLEKTSLKRGENGIVQFTYDPPARKDTDSPYENQQLRLRLVVQPFNQAFAINLNLQRPQ
ncbi:MAG: hypothetical protein ABI811_10515 [Acidobacteriota bacterium]